MKKIWDKRWMKIVCVVFGIAVLFLCLFFSKRENFSNDLVTNPEQVSRVTMKSDKEIMGFANKKRIRKVDEKLRKISKDQEKKQAEKIVEKGVKEKRQEAYFTTSIIDGEIVTVREYAFTIMQLNEAAKLLATNVWVNGNQSDFKGKVYLPKEKNRIEVCCSYRNSDNTVLEVSKQYTVYVDTEHVVICTNLENKMHADKQVISFEAYGYYQGKQLAACVYLNEEYIEEKQNNQYEGQLLQGKNRILIKVNYKKQSVSKSYVVYWNATEASKQNEKTDVVSTGEDLDENAPTLNCNLEDGKTVNNEKLNFQVNAKDVNGKWLDQTHFQVTCGGKKASLIYANEDQISFRVTLLEGYNVILVKVEDDTGHAAKKAYSIVYKKLENGVVGTATISVEASTIGCGMLVSKTKVTVKENTNAAQILCELLEDKGYIVEYGGSLDKGFYLARISRAESFLTPKIPKDLEKHLKSVDSDFPGDYYEDSLGEFDFSYGSGWMYQVNGIYPNYGFSDCYLQDGDELRVRFTLHYGADIGGAMAKGNGGNEGDSGNWEKEW